MVIDFYNRNGGGGGGTADYATSAGTSNSTKLLEGEGTFPSNANNGDVVAIGEQAPTRGTKSLAPTLGIYQYDGSAWNPIGGETPDFTELMPVSSFPEVPVTGEVVAIVEQPEVVESVNPTRGGAKSPVQPEEVSIYQFDGVNWNKIGGGEGDSSAYKIELSSPNHEDFTQEDIDALNDFFAAVEADPSIAEGAYLFTQDIYRCVFAYYDSDNNAGDFTFSRANSDSIETISFHFEDGEYSEGNYYVNNFESLYPSYDFPADPVEGQIANYDDGQGNIGLYQYDGEDWQQIGGGETPDVTTLTPVEELPSGAKTGDVVALGNEHLVYSAVLIPSKYLTFEGNDVLELTTDYGVLTVNTYEKDGYNTIYFETDDAQGSEIVAADGKSTTLPTLDENYTWEMGYDDGVYIRIKEDNTPIYVFTEDSITLNDCDAYLGGSSENKVEIGLYQYNGEEWTSYATENDLSNYFRKEDGEENQDLLAWNGYNNTWGIQRRDSIITEGIREAYEYDDNDGLMFFGRDGYWGVGWKKIDQTTLKPKEALPVEAEEDGSVFALSSSGYGIYQAQSAHTELGWFSFVGKPFPQGVVTKIRVPYDDDGESNIVGFRTDPNGEGALYLYWHPEDPSSRYWDVSTPNGMSQENEEFSITDPWGNSVDAVKVGDYIEVTFGAPIYDEDYGPLSTYGKTEAYTTGTVTDYRRVAFYDEIGGGGSGSQGPQGPQGATGAQGPQGADGAQGPQGPAGSGSGGSSYISDLQPLGINILEGQGVGYASDDDGEGHVIMYTTIEPFNDGSAYVYNYTDDGQGGWTQSESYQLLRPEDIKNEQDDIVASGIIDSNDRVLKIDPDSDGTTQVGGYEPGVGDEPTFTLERYLVSSTNISKMVKITQSDYDNLVLGDEVDENTFYIVVADPEPDPNEP